MEENRYSRHHQCTPDFCQAALSDAVVLIVGMGGLGSIVSMSLAAAGLGTLILCDHDTVSISNLNRQFLYKECDIGKLKVRLAVERLRELNPDPLYIMLESRFDEDLQLGSVRPQLIVDCLDNLASRFELIAYAAKNNIPLVHGAVEGFMGQLSFFMPHSSACPLCSMTSHVEADERMIPSLGVSVSVLGGLQAMEAIKFFTSSGDLCVNRLKFFDGLTGEIDTVRLEKDNNCMACSGKLF